MSISSKTRRAMLGIALAASAAGTTAQAQEAAPAPVPGAAAGVVTINCCKCLGQASGAINISTGTAPWRVSSTIGPMNSPTNNSPLMAPGNIGANPLPNVWTNALAPASWLQPSSATTIGGFANGHVTYVLKIRVPNCTIGQRVVLNGRLAADDKGVIFVDGPSATAPVALSPALPPQAGFSTAWVKTFSHPLGLGSNGFTQPGTYAVRVEVDNLGGGPFGMVLNGTANGKCDDKLEKGREGRAEDCKDC